MYIVDIYGVQQKNQLKFKNPMPDNNNKYGTKCFLCCLTPKFNIGKLSCYGYKTVQIRIG